MLVNFVKNLLTNRFGIILATMNVCFLFYVQNAVLITRTGDKEKGRRGEGEMGRQGEGEMIYSL